MDQGLLIRHTAAFPCPVCRGWSNLPQGRGIRCAGMTGSRIVWCTREEFAGNAAFDPQTEPPSYRHRRWGLCPCGHDHAAALGEGPFLPVEDVLTSCEEPEKVADHEVYAYAIGLLSLRNGALADLRRRGLSLEAIGEIGYRSVPIDLPERRDFLAKLTRRFGEERLHACAAFTDKNDHLFFWTGASYVVPYLDEQRRITGLQVKEIGGKYFTARGAKAAEMYHVAGPRLGVMDLFVSEGGLKAEVASRASGLAVFGVPGQSLSPAHLKAIKPPWGCKIQAAHSYS
jgi:hypothetical protein